MWRRFVPQMQALHNTALKVASEIGENVHALRFDYGVSGSGPSIAAAAHPNAEEHREYANAIIEYIKENKLL